MAFTLCMDVEGQCFTGWCMMKTEDHLYELQPHFFLLRMMDLRELEYLIWKDTVKGTGCECVRCEKDSTEALSCCMYMNRVYKCNKCNSYTEIYLRSCCHCSIIAIVICTCANVSKISSLK